MRGALAGLGVASALVAWCALLPVIAVSLGSVALASLIGAGAVAFLLLVAVVWAVARRRGRCQVEPGDGR